MAMRAVPGPKPRPKTPPPAPLVRYLLGAAGVIGAGGVLFFLFSGAPPAQVNAEGSGAAPVGKAESSSAASQSASRAAVNSKNKPPSAAETLGPPPAPLMVLKDFEFPVSDAAGAKERLAKILRHFEETSNLEKEAALKALCEMGPLALELLPAAIASASEEALPFVAMACVRLKAENTVPALIARIEKDGAAAGFDVFRALGTFGTREARNFAMSLLKAKDPSLQRMGWEAYALCKDIDLEFLFKGLDLGNEIQRNGSIQGLAKLVQNPELIEKFKEQFGLALKDKEGKARYPYAEALSRMPPAPFEGLLTLLLFDQDPVMRVWAVKGFSRDKQTSRQVVNTLNNPSERDPQVIQACLDALVETPNFDAVPRLIVAMNSKTDFQRYHQARSALKAAFGMDMGEHAPAWSVWIAQGERSKDPGRRRAFEEAQKRREEIKELALSRNRRG